MGETVLQQSDESVVLRFEQHLESMMRLASMLLLELRPSATRVLYDSQYLAAASADGDPDLLRETFQDLLASSHEISRWAARLQRFVEEGTKARERLQAGALITFAHRLAHRAIPNLEVHAQGLENVRPIWTNLLLAGQTLGDCMVALRPDPQAQLIGVRGRLSQTETVTFEVGVLMKENAHGLHLMRECPYLPFGEAFSTSSFDVMVRVVDELGGHLVSSRDGYLEFSLPSYVANTAERSEL